MNRYISNLLLTGTLAVALTAPAVLSPTAAHAATKLTDTNNSYAKTEIAALVDAQIISGYGDGSFHPEATMTRSEFATLLAKTLKLPPDVSASQKFTDVDDWARPYVGALVTANLTSGATATTFGANDPISREQLAAFYIRALGTSEQAQKFNFHSTFVDEDNVSDYAKPFVSLTQHIGFIKGSQNADGYSEFNPQGNADRQAVARLAYEFFAHRDTYKNQITKIAGVVDLLDRSSQAMNNVTSTHSETTMNLNEHAIMTMNMDVHISPLAAHATGTVITHDDDGNSESTPIELYIQDDWMYSTEKDGSWRKTKGTNSEFEEMIKVNHQNAEYHQQAPYLTLQEQGNTYVLTGTIPSQGPETYGQPVLTKVTIEIDKATLYEKRVSTEESIDGEVIQKLEMTFSNFNTAAAVVIPDDVKAKATE